MNPVAAMAAYAAPIKAAMAPFNAGNATARDVHNLRTAVASIVATRLRFERDVAAALARSDALAAGLSPNPLPEVLKMVDLHREYAQDLARMAADLLGLEDALRAIVDGHERENEVIR